MKITKAYLKSLIKEAIENDKLATTTDSNNPAAQAVEDAKRILKSIEKSKEKEAAEAAEDLLDYMSRLERGIVKSPLEASIGFGAKLNDFLRKFRNSLYTKQTVPVQDLNRLLQISKELRGIN